MYEETKSSIDWKGIFLKVIIAFLVVLIAVKGYSTLKGNNKKQTTNTTTATAESKATSTFTENIEKLKNAGEKYFTDNKEKLPKSDNTTTMVTLNELIDNGVIETLSDEDGKTCDGESSYVTALVENKKTKIKANLVCGNASSYKLTYLSDNGDDNSTSTVSNTSKETSTKTYSTNSGNTCTASNCGSTKTNVSSSSTSTSSSTVTIKGNSGAKNTSTVASSSTTSKYTVYFDTNGSNTSYPKQVVLKNDVAENPGNPYKYGYTFKGWYLNGSKYDFDTPVTRNITLVAKYTKNSNNNYDNNNDYDYDYDDDYNNSNSSRRVTKTLLKKVYSIGWENYKNGSIKINHTLRVPSEIANNSRVTRVRLKSVNYYSSLTTNSQISTYDNRHSDTFIYTANGFEATDIRHKNMSNIRYATVTTNDNYFKNINDAIDEGFDVSWYSNSYNYINCSEKFHVWNPYNDSYIENLCGYGIIYNATWEYEYYN